MGAYWEPRHGRVRSDEVGECAECGRFGFLDTNHHWHDSLVRYDSEGDSSLLCTECAQQRGEIPELSCVSKDCVKATADGDALSMFDGWVFCDEHAPKIGVPLRYETFDEFQARRAG